MFPHLMSRSRLLSAQFHPPVNLWCDVPMALNYVNCLPNQPVYKHQFSPNQRTAAGLSPNRRSGREAAQFPPTNIATVELVTVVTSFLAGAGAGANTHPAPASPDWNIWLNLWTKTISLHAQLVALHHFSTPRSAASTWHHLLRIWIKRKTLRFSFMMSLWLRQELKECNCVFVCPSSTNL